MGIRAEMSRQEFIDATGMKTAAETPLPEEEVRDAICELEKQCSAAIGILHNTYRMDFTEWIKSASPNSFHNIPPIEFLRWGLRDHVAQTLTEDATRIAMLAS